MAQQLSSVRCPNCGSPIQSPIEQIVDVGVDPSIKARFLSGSLNYARCGVCGFEGQVATPLLYHDPEKELLLTFLPPEINLAKDEQERVIGSLINQVIDRLPNDQRKAYLLQPVAVLTMQGLIERILEADGVTKEVLDEQREKMRLFEELLQTPEENIEVFVKENDDQFDSVFYQLASLSIQTATDENAQAAATSLLEKSLEHSTYGKKIRRQEVELRIATEQLSKLGQEINLDQLIDLFVNAPNEERIIALVNLVQPALNYSFFQGLTERIESSEGDQREHLERVRDQILDISETIEKVQEVRAAQANELLKRIIESEDLEKAVLSALPAMDDLFIGVLQANLRAAEEKQDEELLGKLTTVDQYLRKIVRESMPSSLQLAQDLMELEDEQEAISLLQSSENEIDENLLAALMTNAQQQEANGNTEAAARMQNLYREALRQSMKMKLNEAS